MLKQSPVNLHQYLISEDRIDAEDEGILIGKIPVLTSAIRANSYYFGHPEWANNYFTNCHRDEKFVNLWQAAVGNWHGKIVVDVGCGPGNLYAALKDVCGEPRLLIGVDVSFGALKMAQKIGYTPILSDGQHLPLISGCADIVIANAYLHHCDNMAQALTEAARLVRPGGLLITDHDPQRSAMQLRGLGFLLWQARLPVYCLMKRGGHSTAEEQFWSLATEVHHKPGDGVTPELYHQTLEPLGFQVKLYPHNHTVGEEVLQGNYGRAFHKFRIAQLLSGINSNSPQAALSLMCVATRHT
ncbi:methyltransferase domain-containing protein [Fortiea sp. LEGE XX443]|uniref:class I SAM-dependent methyltransferase n=1 Tax=Fortiea sp. LEGE XX443 TaxID=1828611 RepID=UPI001882FF22|nr:class I SAM-dependent methyltransferase [Fortiea sp. LEGE XX443]MBE9005838.1 methyltransferase domain-containing protein [Fortiea sp. LEGE XX443]